MEVLMTGALTDRDGFGGELKGLRDVTGFPREIGFDQRQETLCVRLGMAVEEALRPPGPGRGDRSLAPQRKGACDFHRNEGGTDHLTRVLVGREGALERRRTKIGMSGEERRRRQRLEIRSWEAYARVGAREQLERLLPGVTRERRSTGFKRVGEGVADRLNRVAHRRRCYIRGRSMTLVAPCQSQRALDGFSITASAARWMLMRVVSASWRSSRWAPSGVWPWPMRTPTASLIVDSLRTPVRSETRANGISSSKRRFSLPRATVKSAARSTKVPGTEA